MTKKGNEAVTKNSTAAELINDFFGGKSQKTVAAYRQDLADFAGHLGCDSIEAAADVLVSAGQGQANATVLRYRNELQAAGKSPATVNRRLAALRSLIKLANTLGIVSWQLSIAGVKSEAYRDTRGPGTAAVATILSALGSSPKDVRDNAIIHLLFDHALRRGEVVGLDMADVDLAAGTVAILGKGRTQKTTIALTTAAKQALTQWVAIRGSRKGPLFTNFDHAGKGNGLTGVSIARIIKAHGQQVGLKVRPHGLRHSAITEALEATNGDVAKVASFSRHKSVQTVMVYNDRRNDYHHQIAEMVSARR